MAGALMLGGESLIVLLVRDAAIHGAFAPQSLPRLRADRVGLRGNQVGSIGSLDSESWRARVANFVIFRL